jgi:hypothetical protein
MNINNVLCSTIRYTPTSLSTGQNGAVHVLPGSGAKVGDIQVLIIDIESKKTYKRASSQCYAPQNQLIYWFYLPLHISLNMYAKFARLFVIAAVALVGANAAPAANVVSSIHQLNYLWIISEQQHRRTSTREPLQPMAISSSAPTSTSPASVPISRSTSTSASTSARRSRTPSRALAPTPDLAALPTRE